MKLFPILLAVALNAVSLQAADSAISIQTHVSRTALYPGDRLEYEVRVEHPASIEFIADHLKKDQLSLDGFEIVEVGSTTSTLAAGKKLFQVKFLLRTFETGNAVATIPSFDLFYFRQGSSVDKNNAQAETVTVPAVAVGLRSTLTDPNVSIRESRPLLAMSTAEWLLPGALGLCALIVVVVWLILLLAARLRSGLWKHRAKETVHQQSWAECLDEIRASEDVEKFYRKASDLLRGLASGRPGEGASLTPRETELALRNNGGSERRAAAVSALLEQCDRIRYAPGGLEKGLDQRSEFLRKLQELAEER